MRKPFSFGLVRYVHDPVGGEFLNVGVVVYSPAGGYLKARCTQRYGRLSCAFGDVPGQHVRSLMAHVERRVNRFGAEADDVGSLDTPMGVFERLFAIDDSSLQFGEGGGGLTDDFDATLERLYERFVGQFEADAPRRKADGDVWKESKAALRRAGVARYLTAHRVSSGTYSHTFDHAIKNGVWHALEPVSFDLASAAKVKDKANKWVGRTVSLEGGASDLKLYYLLGRPERAGVQESYEQAKDILHMSRIPHEIIEEDEVEDFAAHMKDLVEDHGDPDLGLAAGPTV